MSWTGGCSCGAIRYEVDAAPLATVACHCTQCQVQSGSAFSISMMLPASGLRIVQGTPSECLLRADSGAAKHAMFCGRCGTRLYNRNEAMPSTVNLKPGTLDDTSVVAPQMHVWTASRQPWVSIPDELPSFEHNPPLPGRRPEERD